MAKGTCKSYSTHVLVIVFLIRQGKVFRNSMTVET